jgi:outer membrane protein TolC
LFLFDRYRNLVSCLLLLHTGGTYAAEKTDLFWENESRNDSEVTLSVGTELQNDIQLQHPLTLQEAEKLALKNDLLTKKLDAESIALRKSGVAATSLPDPKLKLGLMNVPTDTLELEQEPMTQQVIGLQQMFPSYNLLDSQGKQMSLMGVAKSHKATNQKREVLRNVRKAWLDVYLQYHTGNIIKKTEDLFTQLVKVTKSQYRSGRGNQQNVVRAQLERSLLRDREIQIKAMKEKALAELGKWVGVLQFNRPLSLDSLSIPELADRDALISSIEKHPSLQASIADADAAKAGVNVAKSRYHPSWMVDLSFGKREAASTGKQRADFMSLMFIVDIPLFTSNRQDKWVSASEKEYSSAQYSSAERKKNLKRTLNAEYSDWLRLSERLQHYRKTVLPQAKQNAKAALNAYRSQATEFDPLMRARLMELNIQLQAIQLFVDWTQTQVNLLYLTGGIGHEVQ